MYIITSLRVIFVEYVKIIKKKKGKRKLWNIGGLYTVQSTYNSCGIFCVGHLWLWYLPRRIAAWATQAFRCGPLAWHFLLPAMHGHSTFINKPMFLALLYMYDLIHCIHVLLTYSLCLSHTGWLWLRAFRTGDWHQWRKIQLLIHTPALYYCVITHCTIY